MTNDPRPTQLKSSFQGTATSEAAAAAKHTPSVLTEGEIHPEVQKLLPEKVQCYLGSAVPYEDFKNFYKDVYDQVASGNHLISGRTTFSTKVAGMTVGIRSLRKRESSALQDIATYLTSTGESASTVDLYYLMFTISRIGSTEIPEIRAADLPTLKTAEKWLALTTTRQLKQLFEDMDETLSAMLLNISSDVVLAKRLAFLELVPRP